MVIPVGEKGGIQKLVRLTRENEDELEIEELDYVRFVPLIGEYGW
jgi:protein-L-isoaspartate O-methyltransferase